MSKSFIVWGGFFAIVMVIAILVAGHAYSRVEVCRAYYREISLFSCFETFPGLPQRRERR